MCLQFVPKCIKAQVIPALKHVIVVLHLRLRHKRQVLHFWVFVCTRSTPQPRLQSGRACIPCFGVETRMCLCVGGESQNQNRYYWPVYLGAERLGPALRFTTWNIQTRLLVILWSFSLQLLQPALEWSTSQTRGERKRGWRRVGGWRKRKTLNLILLT